MTRTEIINRLRFTDGHCVIMQSRPHGRTTFLIISHDMQLVSLDPAICRTYPDMVDDKARDGNGFALIPWDVLPMFYESLDIPPELAAHYVSNAQTLDY